MHYFFGEQGGKTYRFSCRNSSYQKMLNADYAPFYEMKMLIFSKGKMTSDVKREGTISLFDDEDKIMYYAPDRNGWDRDKNANVL